MQIDRIHIIVLVLAACVVLGAGRYNNSYGQGRWVQTVQVVIPVDEQPAIAALLDTLDAVLQRRDIEVRRAPDGEAYTYGALEEQLAADGLHLFSATHLFITYQFDLNPHKFSVEVLDLYFIYRPTRINQADISILYLDAGKPGIQRILKQSGVRSTSNQALIRRFWDQLLFYQIKEEATIVRVGNQIMRDSTAAAEQKERLLRISQRYSY